MMQAVILAAGKGTRCYPLTLTRPKVLLKVANKTLLEHNLEQLDGLVGEVIIVVGPFGEMVKEKIGRQFGRMRARYVEQKKPEGSGAALRACQEFLKGTFLVLNGDDLYSRQDIERCLKHELCVMGKEVTDPEKWGILAIHDGKVVGLEEKPAKAVAPALANTGLYVFDERVFEHALKKSKRGEYEITDYLKHLVKQGEHIFCEQVKDFWIPVGYPWHILDANECLLKRMKHTVSRDAVIEKGATLKGDVSVGKGTIIKSGAYIEGPAIIGEDCTIGPNCYIRLHTTIGNGCRVNNGTEVKNSVFFDHTYASHLSYVCDSVLGENVNIGAGTIVADLRHDGANIKTKVNDKLIDTGRRKFGTVIGDGAKTGIHTSIYPGRKIWPGKTTLPNDAVRDDIAEGKQ